MDAMNGGRLLNGTRINGQKSCDSKHNEKNINSLRRAIYSNYVKTENKNLELRVSSREVLLP